MKTIPVGSLLAEDVELNRKQERSAALNLYGRLIICIIMEPRNVQLSRIKPWYVFSFTNEESKISLWLLYRIYYTKTMIH